MTERSAPKLTRVQWLICVIASIGFAFDIYELLMLPLVVRPALLELAGVAPGTPEFGMWVGRLFYIPAFVGGICGLLGGYLTDLLGRRRVLTWSILLYAVSAFLAGYATSVPMLLFFRCTTFIGVCVEFVAAVAWLAELFDDHDQRERVLGYTQAFSSIGGLLVAVANGLAVAYADSLPSVHIPEFLTGFWGSVATGHENEPWRYTLMSGLIPAIPLIVIRPFLPESPKWAQRREAGTLKRPSLKALFSPELRKTSIVTMLLFACSYGAAFGAIQQMPRIIPALPEVKAEVAKIRAGADEKVEEIKRTVSDPDEAKKKIGAAEGAAKRDAALHVQATAASVTKVQEIGGLLGRVLLAVLIVRLASRQRLLRIFLTPGLIVMPVVFALIATTSLPMLYVGMFLAGLLTVGQFSFWGNYLPTVYPMHLRGTGESFAANIGGRLIGTSMAWVTSTLAVSVPFAKDPAVALGYAAALVGTSVYVAAFALSFLLPEPSAEMMSEE